MVNKIQHHWRLGMKNVGNAARLGHKHYNYFKGTLGNATRTVSSLATTANAFGLLGDDKANAINEATMDINRGIAAVDKVEGAAAQMGTSLSNLQKGGATTAGIVDTMGSYANLRDKMGRP